MSSDGPAAVMSVLEALGDEGLARLEQFGRRQVFGTGETVFTEGEAAEECHLLLSGAVEAFVVLEDGAERLVHTARRGALLGALALTGDAFHAGRMRAVEPTEVVTVPRGGLRHLLQGSPDMVWTVVPAVMRQMAEQALVAVRELVATTRWAASISGLTRLPFGELVTTPHEVALRLLDGRTVTGRVLRFDEGEGGGWLVVDAGRDRLEIVRLAAVASIECPRPDVSGEEE